MSRPNVADEFLVVASVSPQRGLRHVRTEGIVSGRVKRRYQTSMAVEPGDDEGLALYQAWIIEYEGAVWPLSPWAVVFRTWDEGESPWFTVSPVTSIESAIQLIAHTAPYDEGTTELFDSDGDPFLSFSAYPAEP